MIAIFLVGPTIQSTPATLSQIGCSSISQGISKVISPMNLSEIPWYNEQYYLSDLPNGTYEFIDSQAKWIMDNVNSNPQITTGAW